MTERRHLAAVGGDWMEQTIATHVTRCEHLIAEEQAKVSPDNALIAALCDSVRMAREYTRVAQSTSLPPKLGPLCDALRPVVSDIFNRLGSLSRGEALQMLVTAAQSAQLATGNTLAADILAVCRLRRWNMHWTSRGAYLHLEASELIEALRGKRGDPLHEAADVLLVLMSITENAGMPWDTVMQRAREICEDLKTRPHYPGEEYARHG
jgi:hypothetical protein